MSVNRNEEARSLEQVLNEHRDAIMQRQNVVGVGIGEKYVGGRNTHRPCITVFVEKKVPLRDLRPEDRLAEEIGGYPVDVVESGRFRAL